MQDKTLKALCDALLLEIGEPEKRHEIDALESFKSGDFDLAKHYCLLDPHNSYLAVVSCITSACRSPMIADHVLGDAARHTAEVAKQRASQRIAAKFEAILSKC